MHTNHLKSYYQKTSDKERFTTGNYAATHRSMTTIKKFKSSFHQLRESNVRIFRKKHHLTLEPNNRNVSPVKTLASLKRGSSLILGKFDGKVKNFLLSLRQKRDVFNTVDAIAAIKTKIQKSNEEHLKLNE